MLFIVLVCRNFVRRICKLKPKNLYSCKKNLGFYPVMLRLRGQPFGLGLAMTSTIGLEY